MCRVSAVFISNQRFMKPFKFNIVEKQRAVNLFLSVIRKRFVIVAKKG